MAVALVHRRVGGEAIEVTLAFRIPHKDAFAVRQNDADRLVIIGAKAGFRREEVGGCLNHPSSLRLPRDGQREPEVYVFTTHGTLKNPRNRTRPPRTGSPLSA